MIPSVYGALVARIRALRSIVPEVRDWGQQNMRKVCRENKAKQNDLGKPKFEGALALEA
jgi:DNA-binding HxlR family transcriptional regulator